MQVKYFFSRITIRKDGISVLKLYKSARATDRHTHKHTHTYEYMKRVSELNKNSQKAQCILK